MQQQDWPARVRAAHVLVVGDVMLDRYWFGSVERISPEAPVPVARVQREQDRLGGAANAAQNIASLGAQATLLSVVGADEPGRRLRELLDASPIRALLHDDAALRTTLKLRVIARQQQLLRLDFETTPDHEVLAAQSTRYREELPAHAVVLCSDYGKGGLGHIADMIAAARAAGRMLLVDPKGRDWARYAGATLLTPNRSELAEVAGDWRDEHELESRAQHLREQLQLQALLVTRAEEGMTLFDATGRLHVPTAAREVYDVSGAVDTVIATLAALLAASATLHEAVRTANRAAGIVVGKLGTASVSAAELWPETT